MSSMLLCLLSAAVCGSASSDDDLSMVANDINEAQLINDVVTSTFDGGSRLSDSVVSSPSPRGGADTAVDVKDGGESRADPGGTDNVAECPAEQVCVNTFPHTHLGDTATLPPGIFHSYGCKPSINEGGSEMVYRVEVPSSGFLSAAVYDDDAVDVDVHILSKLDPNSCVSRGHRHAKAHVTAGTWYVVVDTWVNSEGVAQSGPYRVDIGFIQPSSGDCGMQVGIMKRVGDQGEHLPMPATGPMVMEAHLVTQQEDDPPLPDGPEVKLTAHYGISQTATGLVMHRQQVWAPMEGGAFYGSGIGSPSVFPVVDEAYYVCMYWTSESRPDKGARMILRQPDSPYAVVVAAGYETGPGNLDNVGGTTEETHFYLNSAHKSVLTLGLAKDQALPLGPRLCTD